MLAVVGAQQNTAPQQSTVNSVRSIWNCTTQMKTRTHEALFPSDFSNSTF